MFQNFHFMTFLTKGNFLKEHENSGETILHTFYLSIYLSTLLYILHKVISDLYIFFLQLNVSSSVISALVSTLELFKTFKPKLNVDLIVFDEGSRYIQDAQCLLLSASDRSLTIYDVSSLTHSPLYCVTGLPNIPTVRYKPKSVVILYDVIGNS